MPHIAPNNPYLFLLFFVMFSCMLLVFSFFGEVSSKSESLGSSVTFIGSESNFNFPF